MKGLQGGEMSSFLLERVMVKGFASGPSKGGGSPKRPGDERWNGPGEGQGPALRR